MKEEDKEKLKSNINSTIDKVDAKLEELKARREELSGEIRRQIDTRIAELEKKRKELVAQSSEFGKSAGTGVLWRSLVKGSFTLV